MFKEYSPMQYLAIDIANSNGLDKETYETRIQWVKDNLDNLENIVPEDPKTYYLYYKAVRALRAAMRGEATGHFVALDAVCSGMQIMSAVMGCVKGMAMTGLVYPDVRTDAYTLVTEAVNKKIPVSVSRKDSKSAVMKHLYGSMAAPKAVFGDKVEFFFEALREEAPGAMQLFDLLKNSWNEELIYNTWELPDFHLAHVPVTETIETRIHVPAIKYTPSVIVEVLNPQDYGVSLIANCVHSIDGYVLRTLIRRCNYVPRKLKNALKYLKTAYIAKGENEYTRKFKATNIADLTMVNDAPTHAMLVYPQDMRDALIRIIEMSLSHKPFEIVTIHDS